MEINSQWNEAIFGGLKRQYGTTINRCKIHLGSIGNAPAAVGAPAYRRRPRQSLQSFSPDKKLSHVIISASGFEGIARNNVATAASQLQDAGGKLILPNARKAAVTAMQKFEYATDGEKVNRYYQCRHRAPTLRFNRAVG